MRRIGGKVVSEDLVKCLWTKEEEARRRSSSPEHTVTETILHWMSLTLFQGPRFPTSLWDSRNLFKELCCPVWWRKQHTLHVGFSYCLLFGKKKGIIIPSTFVSQTHHQLPIFFFFKQLSTIFLGPSILKQWDFLELPFSPSFQMAELHSDKIQVPPKNWSRSSERITNVYFTYLNLLADLY